MSIFQKAQQAKQLWDLRSKAMAMQKALGEERIAREKGEVKVVISCDQKVHRVEVNGENNEDIVDALNDALKESQKTAAKKMQEMGGLEGLRDMLGG